MSISAVKTVFLGALPLPTYSLSLFPKEEVWTPSQEVTHCGSAARLVVQGRIRIFACERFLGCTLALLQGEVHQMGPRVQGR